MRISPVKAYVRLIYPTKEKFITSPELFVKFVPFNWKNKKLLLKVLSFFILGGLNKIDDAIATKEVKYTQSDNKKSSIQKQKEKVCIAPIFLHGEGRGTIGCIVVSPPVFLSEDEAKDVIMKAFKKANIEFDTSGYEVIILSAEDKIKKKQQKDYNINDVNQSGITIGNKKLSRLKRKYNLINDEDEFYNYRKKIAENSITNINFDGYNKKYNLAFEFVSRNDYFSLGGLKSSWSVQGFDLTNASRFLREKMSDYNKIHTGVFYDPMVKINENEIFKKLKKYGNYREYVANKEKYEKAKKLFWEKEKEICEEEKEKSIIKAKQLLKAQVNDFIVWVKKEGILKK